MVANWLFRICRGSEPVLASASRPRVARSILGCSANPGEGTSSPRNGCSGNDNNAGLYHCCEPGTFGHRKGRTAQLFDTGADAQSSCELLVEGSFHDYVGARSAGACEGMIETAMFFAPNLPPDVRACPPALGSILESAKVLLRYLDQNPDRLNVPGITLAFEAFRDAWPCQGDDAEPAARPAPKKRVPKKSNSNHLLIRRSRRWAASNCDRSDREL